MIRYEYNGAELALLASPLVDDCRIVIRRNSVGAEKHIAYVVAAQSIAADNLCRQLDDAAGGADYYVPVAALPLDENGEVDDAALLTLPVIDGELLQRWEADLRPGTAIVIGEARQPERRVHLWDVIPGYEAESATDQIIPLETDASARGASEMMATVPAFSDGGPLVIPDDAPRTLTEAILRTVERFGQKGIHHLRREGDAAFQSYAEVFAEAQRILGGLRSHGLRAGDRAILQVESLPRYFPTFWACILGGITPVTVAKATAYDAKNAVVMKMFLAWTLLEKPAILASESLVGPLEGLIGPLPMEGASILSVDRLREYEPATDFHQAEPGQVAFFQLSSGTTGPSKAICETHHAIIHHIHGVTQYNGYESDDVTINWLPMDHVVPLLMYHIKDLYSGITQIQIPTDQVLADPLIWLDVIQKYRVTHFWSPNFGYKMLNERLAKVTGRSWDLSSVKWFFSGGEQVTWPVVQEFLRRVGPFGVPMSVMQPSYGMAEMATGVTFENSFSPEKSVHFIKKASLLGRIQRVDGDGPDTVNFVGNGPPIPGTQVRIVDNNDQVLPEGVIGRIQVRGAMRTPGYFNNEKAVREAFLDDGWYNSGDLGFLLNGSLTITGREKELIIINGANFYCTEIEDVVNSLSGIETTFVAACGFHNPDSGTDGLAVFFSPTEPSLAANADVIKAIRGHVAQQIGIASAYVIPIPKAEFPKTTSGKLQRTKLKQGLASGQFRETIKAVDLLLASNNTLPDWFHQRVWHPRAAKPAPTGPGGRTALIFADRTGLGERVCERLEALGCRAALVEAGDGFAQLSGDRYRIDPRQPEQYRQLLLSTAHPDHVIHLWTCDDLPREPTDAEALRAAQHLGAHSLLLLVRALASVHAPERTVRLTVVSSHAQPVVPGQPLAVEKAPLLGVLATLPQELPWLACRHVDLAADEGQDASAGHIVRELTVPSTESEVAYRGGRRYAPRLKSVDWSAAGTVAIPLRIGGIYLVTGGLGGLGSEVAAGLLRHYKARILAVGRSPLPPRESEAGRRYEELAALGQVRYVALDVGDGTALERAVAQAETDWGATLAGVIHAAGVIHETMLAEESLESYDATLSPKLLGSWQLWRLLDKRPDAIFIGFSSVYGTFSSMGVGAYASANRFLDHFVHELGRKGTKAYSLAWSMWDDLGMSQGAKGLQGLVKARGNHILPSQRLWQFFMAGLRCGLAHLFIGLDEHHHAFRRQMVTEVTPQQPILYFVARDDEASALPETLPDHFGTPTRFDAVPVTALPMTTLPGGETVVDRDTLRNSFQAAATSSSGWEAPRNDLERQIAGVWEEVLDVPEVGIHDNFLYLGGHSIKAMQCAFRLTDLLQVEVTVRDIFEALTVAELTHRIPALPAVGTREQPEKKRTQGKI